MVRQNITVYVVLYTNGWLLLPLQLGLYYGSIRARSSSYSFQLGKQIEEENRNLCKNFHKETIYQLISLHAHTGVIKEQTKKRIN
ncbi:hypothetical protein VNO77_04701 [Canavalia gladiata]|uniref:Uncharacterized protein n=1 Tax=Canavalia gladiata TaxID=3824 RepID=A0AAN9R9B3_CANGL